MGGGPIFLKSRCDVFFHKDLSNEPNFDWIHLAGQYLYKTFPMAIHGKEAWNKKLSLSVLIY
jgi:hypothetical protein